MSMKMILGNNNNNGFSNKYSIDYILNNDEKDIILESSKYGHHIDKIIDSDSRSLCNNNNNIFHSNLQISLISEEDKKDVEKNKNIDLLSFQKKYFFTREEAINYCRLFTEKFVLTYLPIILYYKHENHYKYEKIGLLMNFIPHYDTPFIHIETVGKYSSLMDKNYSSIPNFIKTIMEILNKDIDSYINGWDKIYYKARNGSFKKLKSLFPLSCRRSESLPTSSFKIFKDLKKQQFVVNGINLSLLPSNKK